MFKKAQACESNACVEVAIGTKAVEVRSSRESTNVLSFDGDEWSTFVEAVKNGEFDLPSVVVDVAGH